MIHIGCVVMTGIPPICLAICSASSLAPPICPESNGITKVPGLICTTTGLSLSLSDTKDAIMRTAMPQAPITTMAFFSANCCLVQSDSDNPRLFVCTLLFSSGPLYFFAPIFNRHGTIFRDIMVPCIVPFCSFHARKACLIFSASFVPFSVKCNDTDIHSFFPLIFSSYEIPFQNPAHTVWISHNAGVPQYLPR